MKLSTLNSSLLTAATTEVVVDFAKETGRVKPVNGVGQPPMLGFGGNSLFHYLTEAGIPFSRLHDTGGAFGKNLYVDIPNLFRDFNADENDPANYDFIFTDDLMVKLDEAGVRPYFRLGVTIENGAAMRAYRIFPPKDFAKWARVCEHVMAHYVEGWANGPRVKVSHWEIWNEADFHPVEKCNQMWQAPFEEYIKLYVTAAKHLKARFPQEKIGGFGSCGFYHVATGDMRDLGEGSATRRPAASFNTRCAAVLELGDGTSRLASQGVRRQLRSAEHGDQPPLQVRLPGPPRQGARRVRAVVVDLFNR